jgi:hypothetical protein
MQSQTAPSDQHGIMPHANIWHLRRFLTGTTDQKYCDDKAKNLTHPGVHAPLLSSSSSALLVVWFFVLCLILPVFRLVRRTSLARLSVIGPPSVITAVKRIARAAARQSLAAFRSLRALGSSTGRNCGRRGLLRRHGRFGSLQRGQRRLGVPACGQAHPQHEQQRVS